MIPYETYINNLIIVEQYKHIEGCIVECGTWRGGMSGGIAMVAGGAKQYYLYDSFDGLPEAKPIDGEKAIQWQSNKQSPLYFDNCKAEISFAEEAMMMAGISTANIIKGWFSDSLPKFPSNEKIAILRLDGDWYESTMTCLESLFDKVCAGGIIIIDDYYMWDGCTRAVHDFLIKHERKERIRQFNNDVCFIVKL